MNAVILAAGKGTRLKEITKTVPKPLLPIRGQPVLGHLLELCARARIDQVFINTHYLGEQIRDFAGDGKKFGLKITYSYEPELLGTAGALNNFRDNLAGHDFFVLYGDNWVDLELGALARFHQARQALATIAVHPRDDVSNSGLIELDSDKRVNRFIEKPPVKTAGLVNAGIYVLSSPVLDYIAPGYSDFGYDIFPKLLAEQQPVFGYQLDHELIAIDTPELLAAAMAKSQP